MNSQKSIRLFLIMGALFFSVFGLTGCPELKDLELDNLVDDDSHGTTDADNDADNDADSDADNDADSDVDSDADSDADTEVEGGSFWYCELDRARCLKSAQGDDALKEECSIDFNGCVSDIKKCFSELDECLGSTLDKQLEDECFAAEQECYRAIETNVSIYCVIELNHCSELAMINEDLDMDLVCYTKYAECLATDKFEL